MGGDFAPGNVIEGVVGSIRESRGRFSVALVGPREVISAELANRINPDERALFDQFVQTVHASEVVGMDEPPNAALKQKKDSSIAVGVTLHRDGNADAFVSAGNTGAVLSASTLILGRIRGISRPTIGALIPTSTGSPTLLLDAGTNVDCRARHLLEFAVMGSIYVSSMFDKPNPSIGLLSIGEEEVKGNETTVEAYSLLKKSSLNFKGNVEGRDILSGKVDVVVCDGFIGNILLKFGESVPSFFKEKFKKFAAESLINKIAMLPVRRAMRGIMKELDYQEHGGVPLLGVNGVSIIGHGGSTPLAIKNMILRAEEIVRRKVNLHIEEAIGNYAA